MFIAKFYAKMKVLFKTKGTYGSQWESRSHGLIQGDSWSAVLLAMIMTLWALSMKEECPNTAFGVFVDDRIWFTQSYEEWEKAAALTKWFDELCKFLWNDGKGVIFSQNSEVGEQLASDWPDIGEFSTNFVYLGVDFYVNPQGQAHADTKIRAKANAHLENQLRRIKIGAQSIARRKRMIQRHITPKIVYGSAWRSFDDKEAARIARMIETPVFPRRYAGRSCVLSWTLTLGCSLHPGFIRDFEAINARVRSLRRTETQDSYAIGKFRDVCDCERWHWSIINASIVKTPEGYLDFTRDSKPAIENWACHAWFRHMCTLESRGSIGLQKWSEVMPCLNAHANWAHHSVPIRVIAATGALPDARSVKGMHACECGEVEPHRAHWFWKCPKIETVEPGDVPPMECKLSYNLAVPLIARHGMYLKADFTIHVNLRNAIRDAVGDVVVATDGSSNKDHTLAGWGAIVVQTTNRRVVKNCSGNVKGADQGSYAAELSAVEEVLLANQHVKKRLSFIIDNKAVLDQLNSYIGGNTDMPKFTFGRWRNIARLVEHQHVAAYWVPSHGKKSECRPTVDGLGDHQEWRRWNDLADGAANSGRDNLAAKLGIEAYDNRVQTASDKAETALNRVLKGFATVISANDDLYEKWEPFFVPVCERK